MLPTLLSDLSEWTWHLLRDAPFRPREETVTEVLLTEFHRRGAGQVWVHKSTVREEENLGLDWAAALRTTRGWLSMIVQAKNVGGRRFGMYPELRKPGAGSQADSLIHTAAMAQALPLYAFYNSEVAPFGNTGSVVSVGGCGRRQLTRGDSASGPPWATGVAPLGVLIAHAADVLSHVIPPPASNQRASTVTDYSMPWECLFCPSWPPRETVARSDNSPPSPNPELPLIARAAIQLAHASDAISHDQQSQNIIGPPEWLQPEAPRWADIVREGGVPELEDDSPQVRFYLVADLVDGDDRA